MSEQKSVVLLSGGQDSTTCLYWAKKKFGKVYAVSVEYGQRHSSELDAARQIAKDAGVEEHFFLPMPAFKLIGDSDLVRADTPINADGGFVDSAMPQGLPSSFVPGRNIVLLALASAIAVKVDARHVVTGVCQTDFSGYPDCRDDFVRAMNEAVNLGMPSSRPVAFSTPLMWMSKADTVRLALELGDACMKAIGQTVTCYHGARPGCGVCPACILRARGFAEAGIVDPARA